MSAQAERAGRAFFAAFADRDRDAFLALMHPEVEMYLPRSVLEGGSPYRGLEGAEQAWADAFDLWERFEVEEPGFDLVGDVFIVQVRVRCFPHREGPPVAYDGHYVMELRDDKIVYSRPYVDPAEARQDAESRSARSASAS